MSPLSYIQSGYSNGYGKPYIVGVAQPNNLLTPDNIVSVGVCSIVLPVDPAGPVNGALYHKFCSLVITGFLDENQDCESTGGAPHETLLDDLGL